MPVHVVSGEAAFARLVINSRDLDCDAGVWRTVNGKSEQELARRYTDNVEAYQLYLRGRFYYNNYARKEDLDRAIQLFQAAIAKDPDYALAYSGVADVNLTLAIDNWRSPNDVLVKARENAMKALALDDALGEAHYSRGGVAFFLEWDWNLSQRELDRALELHTKSLESDNACYLHSRDSLGKPDETLATVHRALGDNPLSININAELSCASYYAHRYDQAIDFSQENLRLDQEYPFAHYNAARALAQEQRYEQAITELIHSTWMPWIKVEPKFESLRSEPRFSALLQRMGFRADRSTS